jgi:outer membrane protein assembly factor BamD
MSRKFWLVAWFSTLLMVSVACSNKKSVNPLSSVQSKQPDKVLFDKAMDAMKHNRYDVARITLQTLINTYPDSEYIARAKLAVGDSWYAEGGTASLAQAEQEYRDFETFFPNMPEAAEAQLKIANIQYQQMEKADRDYTHAKRAEEEYRNLIMQYPDNPKLVQEVLAEREFEIGKFYYLRMSYPASIARLRTLVDQYPLYSQADQALYLLGQDYEGQIAQMRLRPTCVKTSPQPGCIGEQVKANMVEELTKEASAAYSQIITRYPLMDREEDAKKRLALLHQPIPRPTKAAVAQNRREEESRREATGMERLMSVVKKGPDVSQAAKAGEPPLVDPTPVAANQASTETARRAMGVGGGDHDVSATVINGGTPGANEPAPRSDAPNNSLNTAPKNADPFAHTAATNTPDPNELRPADAPPAKADPNELTPAADQSANAGPAPVPPPVQVNELQTGQASASGSPGTSTVADASSSLATDKDISSSKKKKKTGLKKIISF